MFLAAGLLLTMVLRKRTGNVLASCTILSITFSGVPVGPLTLPDLFLIPAFLIGSLKAIREDWRFPTWLIGSFLLITACALVPAIVTNDISGRVGLLRMSFAMLLVCTVIGRVASSSAEAEQVASLYVLSAAANVVYGIAQKLVALAFLPTASGGFRVAGLTAHPNQLGLICATALPLAIDLSRKSTAWLFAATLCAAGIVVSGSRMALLAGVFGILAFLKLTDRIRVAAFVQLAVIGVLALSLLIFAPVDIDEGSAITRLMEGEADTVESNNARIESVQGAFRAFQQAPVFGVGTGPITEDQLGAHNLYLILIQVGGIATLAGFSWFVLGAVRKGKLDYRQNRASMYGLLVLATWLFAGLTQPGYYDRWLYFGPGLLAARSMQRSNVDSLEL